MGSLAGNEIYEGEGRCCALQLLLRAHARVLPVKLMCIASVCELEAASE